MTTSKVTVVVKQMMLERLVTIFHLLLLSFGVFASNGLRFSRARSEGSEATEAECVGCNRLLGGDLVKQPLIR